MKLFRLLLISLFALPAVAAAGEVLDPFYAPNPGHILSKTSVTAQKFKYDGGAKFNTTQLMETIYYAIDPSWTLFLDGSNTWVDPEIGGKYEIRSWDAGIGYFFMPTETTSLDLELYYTESKPEDADIYKTLFFYGRYDFMKDNDVKPFIGLTYARGLHQITKSDDSITAFVGAWKKFDNVLLRGDVITDYDPDEPEATDISLRLETGYQFNEKLAIDLYGSYNVYSHYQQAADLDSSFGGGIMVRYEF